MNIAAIVVLAIIVVLSIIGVLTAKEPLDDVFAVNAALEGFPLQPLATKVTTGDNDGIGAKESGVRGASEGASGTSELTTRMKATAVRAA